MKGVTETAGVAPLRAVAYPADDARTAVLALGSAPGGYAPLTVAGVLGTREDIQRELDGIAADVRSFWNYAPDDVMRRCAAYTARLTEMVVLLHRVEQLDRQYARVRTMQVQQWIEELDRQYKIASRLIEVMRQDIALMGGHT